ncbi:TIR domain-containing protein [Streptomyces sp. WI04-05B]|uniref:tetratricopeptide repeat protein n=1 Tax=Streptomyces TaxID=1883 RepID=UPI0029AA7AAA|nr:MULTISPECIES: toll/interleukin-1 receptor domain-containing protein [unclassified Streptomyces]MDX2541221.1 toll/interleukin-1 receptor domain-containing protein [Streptomyces sp. WI04-05B]MDX2585549.1 toll/interleukin-1 receptor domain-containing protein [Streptomyces sp. WI04-05A]
MWDVFLSYSRGDVDRVRPLVRALSDGGLSVFTDETGVASFAGISDTIRRELARSKALLAYYSAGYPEREACQWELTTAYLAGLGEGDPRRRVMVVNPEHGNGHIHPVELRDARHASADDLDTLTTDVREHVGRLDGPMPVREYGAVRRTRGTPQPFPEFLGRLPELWQVHSALHAHSAPLVTGRAAAHAVQIRGMAGIGKTRLAQEYALRFEAAYPGGVYWLSGESYEEYEERFDEYAAHTGSAAHPGNTEPGHVGTTGEPFLWIVDGMPDARLSGRELARLAAPRPGGHTLFTLRSRAYDGLGTSVDLGPLDAARARVLVGDDVLAQAVGGHPGALDLLGRAVRAGHRPASLYDGLHGPGASPLDTLADSESGNGIAHVTASLVRDVDTPDAADVLRCAAALHPLPLGVDDVAAVLAATDAVPHVVAHRRAATGIAELRVRSLLSPLPEDRWQPHPVVLHAWRHHDPAPARAEALRRAALRTLCGRRGPVTLALPGSRREVPMAVPSESERMAAFDIQIELVTRIGVQELAPGTGSLREALTSLKSLIDFTRGTLHTYNIGLQPGSTAGAVTVQSLAYALINDTIRPFTTTWHPRLAAHETGRPAAVAPLDHEAAWSQASAMRAELTALREPLVRVAAGFGGISGADFGVPAAG